MNIPIQARVLAISLLVTSCATASKAPGNADQQAFDLASAADWQEVFHDPGTGDWRERWFLDGEVGTVKNTPKGMELTSGPEARNDAHHMVLWTKAAFTGDLRIDYEFTRLDSSKDGVNILYIQATGSGAGPYHADIATWSELRRIPAMKQYFNHMNTYHISYSVGFPGNEYVRARRYLPEGKGLNGSEITPDYGRSDLFEPGVPHRLTLVKRGQTLFLRVQNPGGAHYFTWRNTQFPPITAGRVGLRQMFTKAGRYADFRIWTVSGHSAP
jgi:hypothetical protein